MCVLRTRLLLLPHDGCFAEMLDYVFYNDTLTFDGSYSVGESECTTVRVFAPDDNLVESTEVFNAIVFPGASSLTSVSIFIIDNDCKWVFVLSLFSHIILVYKFSNCSQNALTLHKMFIHSNFCFL